jgi:hypothetical protein
VRFELTTSSMHGGNINYLQTIESETKDLRTQNLDSTAPSMKCGLQPDSDQTPVFGPVGLHETRDHELVFHVLRAVVGRTALSIPFKLNG